MQLKKNHRYASSFLKEPSARKFSKMLLTSAETAKCQSSLEHNSYVCGGKCLKILNTLIMSAQMPKYCKKFEHINHVRKNGKVFKKYKHVLRYDQVLVKFKHI